MKRQQITGLYFFTFPDDKEYFGHSNDCLRRFNQHKSRSRDFALGKFEGQRKLNNAINKFGWSSIKFDIIPFPNSSFKDRTRLEKWYISMRDTFHNGYNDNGGGSGPGEVFEVARLYRKTGWNKVTCVKCRWTMHVSNYVQHSRKCC